MWCMLRRCLQDIPEQGYLGTVICETVDESIPNGTPVHR